MRTSFLVTFAIHFILAQMENTAPHLPVHFVPPQLFAMKHCKEELWILSKIICRRLKGIVNLMACAKYTSVSLGISLLQA